MNAIIALCHFCEQHGPRVLFCTQPFHEQEPLETLESVDGIASGTASSLTGTDSGAANRPHRFLRSRSVDSESIDLNKRSLPDTCEACLAKEGCRSLRSGQTGYISNDTEARVRYVSGQQPYSDSVFSFMRQACIRSLSSEVCPGREGPIFFGDSNTRYVLSYTFYLEDTRSRGRKRLFSIIVVMKDKIYLLNSWPFLVKHLKDIVSNMQTKASRVFQMEEAKCSTRASRLQSQERSCSLPTQVRLKSNSNRAIRSLADMTADPDLFKSLHLSFTWVLKACSNRLTEKLLEGPPTEDAIVDLERKEEIVDDFVLVNTEKVTHSENSTAANSCTLTEESSDFSPDDRSPTFDNLRELYESLGFHPFHQLAHHVIIGNQIIVQTDSPNMTRSIIDCLQILLPKGCCKTIYNSDKYEESWKCNFLGLSKFCELPGNVVNSEHYVLINVESPVPCNRVLELTTNKLQGYRIELHTGQPPLDKSQAPKILEKMERAIANLNLSWSVVAQCLICIKEEWMNKVKVLFTFTKAGGSRSEDDTKKLLQVFGATEEDKRALKFWMTGLSHQYKNHMRHTCTTKLM